MCVNNWTMACLPRATRLPKRASALRGYRGDERLDVAERVREPLAAVHALDLRYMVGHHHPVVADFLVDAHGFQHVDGAVVDERLAEVEEAALDVAEMDAEDF